MAEQPWFKVWAKASLASGSLNRLTDHQERVWWRLLMVAATEEPRGSVSLPIDVLSRLCASTPAKCRDVLRVFVAFEMIELDGAVITISNWDKYQYTPGARRVRKHRDKKRAPTVTSNVTRNAPSNADVTVEVRGKRSDLPPSGGSAPDGADHDGPFGDRYGSLVDAFGGNISQRLADEFTQIAEDWTDLKVIQEAIRTCQRLNKRSYPSEVRKYLPPLIEDKPARPRDPGAGIPSFDELRNMPWVQGVRS